jgi:hypothetical protein
VILSSSHPVLDLPSYSQSNHKTAIQLEEVVTIGTMITGRPETNEVSAEKKSEANDMVPIQKLKEKKNGSGKSRIEIGDDVALTFPQRVGDDKRMLPLGSILFELSLFLSDEDSSTRHCSIP